MPSGMPNTYLAALFASAPSKCRMYGEKASGTVSINMPMPLTAKKRTSSRLRPIESRSLYVQNRLPRYATTVAATVPITEPMTGLCGIACQLRLVTTKFTTRAIRPIVPNFASSWVARRTRPYAACNTATVDYLPDFREYLYEGNDLGRYIGRWWGSRSRAVTLRLPSRSLRNSRHNP